MKKMIGIAAAVLFVVACGAVGVFGTDRLIAMFESSDETETGDAEGQATRVTVGRPEIRELDDSFRTVATILAARSIELRPLTEGRVIEIAVESGQDVAEGDLIAALDARAAEAALTDARATLTEAEASFDRIDELADENVAADAQLDTSRATFERAEAGVAAAEAALEDRRIVAPFDGVVGIVDLDPGELIDPATVITTLDDLSTVEAAFAVPERYYERVEAGQRVELQGAIYEDRTFEGDVVVKAPRIDPASRAFDVRVRVDNADRALTEGMFMTATLIFETYEAPTLPEEAIISEGETTYVYVAGEDGTAIRTEVGIGAALEGRSEITEGVDEGTPVVMTGYEQLTDGAPIEIAEAGETPEGVEPDDDAVAADGENVN
ncbi:efflux RND transporter periplasmic adaptor subunit [uncultured Jannaschia sp.]|uniref:efflux RND transporter periplasmic adaptor subunit n=1 Tax=uncultured Jannaschia sp. TaxID=293347 RepID=UPI002634F11E|nr:efflux RND transporter periplasmic adaptor subunit [uncultured Jannaschia sp.]